MQPTVAVDLDGTLCHYAFPACGAPLGNVIEALRRLRAEGWRVIIHSSRVNAHWPDDDRRLQTAAMMLYLLAHDIPWDELWGVEFTADGWRFRDQDVGKPVAHAYLDDRSPWWRPDATADEIVAACRELYRRGEADYEEGMKGGNGDGNGEHQRS